MNLERMRLRFRFRGIFQQRRQEDFFFSSIDFIGCKERENGVVDVGIVQFCRKYFVIHNSGTDFYEI